MPIDIGAATEFSLKTDGDPDKRVSHNAEPIPQLNLGPTEFEQREIEARWLATMARIGAASIASEPGPGRAVFTPTGSGRVAFDILDIINGICDVADRVGAAVRQSDESSLGR